MKVVAISNSERAQISFQRARQEGYITFIYHHADPQHTLSPEKFTYVNSDEELVEKINLLKQDPTVQEQVIRW